MTSAESVPPALEAFSRYLSGRNEVLRALALEITALLDRCAGPDCPERARASSLVWLWTLGAYEVTRTICQAHECFSPRFLAAVSVLKSELEQVRVPNTKMERVKYDRKERSVPVSSDREADTWEPVQRDLQVGDPNRPASSRALFAAYARTFDALQPDEVLMGHEAAFARRGP